MTNKSKHSEHKDNKVKTEPVETPEVEIEDVSAEDDGDTSEDVADDGQSEIEALKNLVAQRDEALEKEKKEYLFLMAEFDNFKKRTMREKAEIIKNGAESAFKGLLPILDDFERGLAAIKDSSDAVSVKEGMELIYNKFIKYLEQNGVKAIPTADAAFDPDLHEAIAMVPVEDETKKGKVVDTIAKGYTLNDKVIRHAKVAVGQ